MIPRQTPKGWRRGFRLYRRQTGRDGLGNETACYDMDAPDLERSEAEGVDVQPQKGWNSAGRVSAGAEVRSAGEYLGGLLECYWPTEWDIAPFDRLEIDGALWEVKSVHPWPRHRVLMLQRLN